MGGRGRARQASLASSCAGSDLIGFMCGNVFQSHTCEIPPHLLAISTGHNTQQREQSPQRLDSLDCSSAFIAAEEKGWPQCSSTASAALSLSVVFLLPYHPFNPSIHSLSRCPTSDFTLCMLQHSLSSLTFPVLTFSFSLNSLPLISHLLPSPAFPPVPISPTVIYLCQYNFHL